MNEDKTDYLVMIQSVITRMATNSFMIRGWSVTLISALFALAAKDSNPSFVISEYYHIYDWVINDGYNNFGNWVEEAAQRAGR